MSLASSFYNSQPDFLKSFRFHVYIGVIKMGFSKISGVERTAETESIQQGGVNDHVYTLSSPVKSEKTLVLERGVAYSRGLLAANLKVGKRLATDMLILIYDDGGLPRTAVYVKNPYVKRHSFSDLDAMSGQVLVERFEVVYDSMEVQSLPVGMLAGIL